MFNETSKDILDISMKVAEKVNHLNWKERTTEGKSILKGDNTPMPDILGEKIIIEGLEKISYSQKIQINLILNADKGEYYKIGKYSKDKTWAYADPVDGTIKLSGLGNDIEKGIYRIGNDGAWGIGLALTNPTTKKLEELTLNDFVNSAIVDGNPSRTSYSPENACTQINEKGKIYTAIFLENSFLPAKNSTQENLRQGIVIFDGFQAFDRKSAPKGAENLAGTLWKRLADRNNEGAFDIWRTYGNISCFLKNQLGFKHNSYEPQGIAYVAINENINNLVPLYWINKGAGGYSVDFNGRDLGSRRLTDKRPNVILAANKHIKDELLYLISK
jgi:hypothetical protein